MPVWLPSEIPHPTPPHPTQCSGVGWDGKSEHSAHGKSDGVFVFLWEHRTLKKCDTSCKSETRAERTRAVGSIGLVLVLIIIIIIIIIQSASCLRATARSLAQGCRLGSLGVELIPSAARRRVSPRPPPDRRMHCARRSAASAR